jgi:hypothetical protein
MPKLFLSSFSLSILECRLKAEGIRCPTPQLLRLHILVMEFIGTAFILHFDTISLSSYNQLPSIVFVISNTSFD